MEAPRRRYRYGWQCSTPHVWAGAADVEEAMEANNAAKKEKQGGNRKPHFLPIHTNAPAPSTGANAAADRTLRNEKAAPYSPVRRRDKSDVSKLERPSGRGRLIGSCARSLTWV